MQRMKSFLTVGVLCSMPGTALATWAPSHYRCTFDQLDATRAEGRQKWAMRGANLNPYNRPGGRDGRFWANIYTDEARRAKDQYGTWLYPVYVDPDDSYQPWKGPGAPGTASQSSSAIEIENLDPKLKSVQILQDGICEPGCYTPNQNILFSDGPVAIGEAQRLGRDDLMTLSPGASFDKIELINNKVLHYTLDQRPAKQQILTFRMASGGHLSVTTEHPIVTPEGNLKRAREFLPGEHLIKQDGTLDEIVNVEEDFWTGRTINLKPTTTDLTSNILVAQGYLNGSGRFQSEYVEELNRLILRQNIPDELIPRS